MKASKFTEAQIAFVLRQAEEGTPIAEVTGAAGAGRSGLALSPPALWVTVIRTTATRATTDAWSGTAISTSTSATSPTGIPIIDLDDCGLG